MAKAAIDIGSNTLLLTIVSDEGQILHDEACLVGLGRGIGDRGLFSPQQMERAESTLTSFCQTAQTLGVAPWNIRAVATSAARRAMNAKTFFDRIAKKLRLRVKIVSGDQEAHLTWLGVRNSLSLPPGPLLVVDLGGGSTEFILGEGTAVLERTSLELGSVRLTEAFLGSGAVNLAALSRLREHIGVQLSRLKLKTPPRTIVGVAGTVTTLAAMDLGLQHWDADAVHGFSLTRPALRRFIDALAVASPDQRRAMALTSPDRADTLLAGAIVLELILERCHRPQLTASDRGLRYGLLMESFSSPPLANR